AGMGVPDGLSHQPYIYVNGWSKKPWALNTPVHLMGSWNREEFKGGILEINSKNEDLFEQFLREGRDFILEELT
ncbi:MAG: hypothetical protein AAF193_12230, partial [Bacteroidota bacterium]